MFSRFSSNKCKTQCKMCISRLKLMRNKRLIGLRNLRKEVAELLKQGKQGNARIRVEAVVRENFTLQAYDIVELFLELISVRVALMEKTKEMPPDMMEAICSIIYAGDRMMTDLQEMAMLRGILVNKYAPVYGKEFAIEASSELTCRKWHVNENLVSCLVIEAPSPQEKIRLLAEIAAEYGVEFDEEAAAADMLTGMAPRPQAAGPFPEGQLDSTPSQYPAPAPFGAPPPWAPQAAATAGAAAAPTPAGGPPSFTSPPAAGTQPPPKLDIASTLNPGVPQAGVAGGPGWAPLEPPAQPGDGFQGHVSSVGNWFKAKRSGSPPKGSGQDEYQDASTAALAARQYSTMAQQAADAAENYARSQGPGAPPPPFYPPSGGGDGSAGGSGSGSAGGSGSGGGRYVKRSDSEIQRAYDAAPGPPSKGEISAPSAPPAPLSPSSGVGGVSGHAADGTSGAGRNGAADDLGLPSAPAGRAKPPPAAPGGNAEQDEVDKELEELTRRFEALKKR